MAEPATRSTGSAMHRAGDPAARVRVLLVEWNEDGTVGGSHRLLFDLVSRLDRERFEPVVLFYQENRFRPLLEAEGIRVVVFEDVRAGERAVRERGGRFRKYADYVGAVARRVRLLRELNVGLVHLINAPWRGTDDWLPACRVAGISCVATVGSLLPKRIGPVQRFLARRFDRLLAVSGSVADGLHRIGVSSNVRVLHPGLDIAAFLGRIQRPPGEVRAALGVAGETILMTMVGHLRPWKGQHVVLEAMARLPAPVRGRLHLLIAGATSVMDRDYADRLLETARRPELEAHVTLLGERLDVPDLVNASDLAVHASLSPEPFGLVVVEALATGTPVVASNRGGPVEILTAESGFLFDPDRPEELCALLERLSESPGALQAMGDAARARAETFSAERMTSEVEGVYASLAGSRAVRA